MKIRRRIRLDGFDYTAAGRYFITTCTAEFKCSLADIDDWKSVPTKIGMIVHDCILKIPNYYPNMHVDHFIIMPNHIHLLLTLINDGTAPVGRAVGALKAASTRLSRQAHLLPENSSLWQYSFHERVVRDDAEYERFAKYIETNPVRWQLDEFYPNWRS